MDETGFQPHIRPPGIVLGSYRIVRLLGEGGMAHVYLAEHVKLGRQVALKLLLPELGARREIAQRFFAEARAVNAIGSENIVDITDFVEEGSEKYFVMELLQGPSLRELMEQGSLPLPRVLDIALQLARTLDVVHKAGILHRDLKPDNVMLVERGGRADWVKLLDFGIAKFMDEEAFATSGLAIDTSDGAVLGTPAYLAPELLQGIEPDFRADVYSFGLLLFQLITGERPFPSRSLPELIQKQMHETAPLLSSLETVPFPIPEDLDSLVRRCLEKPRDLRPPSMAHVVAELEMVCEQLGLSLMSGPAPWTASAAAAPRVAAASPGAVRPARRQLVLAAAVATGVVLVGALALALSDGDEREEGAAPDVKLAASELPPESPASSVPPRVKAIDEGDAHRVLAALDEAGASSWTPEDKLVRGHALWALGRKDDAWSAYDAAVGARAVDERLLARALGALEERHADGAMDVLASWPDARVTSALLERLDDEGWWPRHHALKVLDDRGEGGAVDRAALAMRDLESGPSCGARKYGLKKLAEHGAGADALAAVERAAKRGDNRCLRSELAPTRAAIAGRDVVTDAAPPDLPR